MHKFIFLISFLFLSSSIHAIGSKALQAINNPSLDQIYGRITSVELNEGPMFTLVVVYRLTYFQFFIEKKTDYPIQFSLLMDGTGIHPVTGQMGLNEFTVWEEGEFEVLTYQALDYQYKFEWNYSFYLGETNAVHKDDYIYGLPFPSGETYQVSQGSGDGHTHTGPDYYAIDWAMPKGTTVVAARSGTVVAVEDGIYLEGAPSWSWSSSANYVYIEHDDGTVGQYFHLSQYSIPVAVGDFVLKGDKIGESGNTGNSSGPHLHFEVTMPRKNFYNWPNNDLKEWNNFVSAPLRFETTSGVVSGLKRGDLYTAL